MHQVAAVQRWEVEIIDVQGRLSSLYLWPGTLTTACLKFQVIRGDVVEHQEVTPFFEVSAYEVHCNYRFMLDVPMNSSHIHLFFISGDLHPVSGKPKLISRAKLSFKDICRSMPLEKYFTLYRRDRVTQNCIPGGYVRLGFCRHRRAPYDEIADGNRMSMDQASLYSLARDHVGRPSNPFESDLETLPPRPSSAVPGMVIADDIKTGVDPEEFDSDYVFEWTDRSVQAEEGREHLQKPAENSGLTAASSTLAEASHEHRGDYTKSSEASTEAEVDPANNRRRVSSHVPWYGILLGATIGALSTFAAVTLRYISRRTSKKRQTTGSEVVCF